MRKEKSCGAVIVKDDRVLLVHQNNNLWSFPKGHMEPGETEIEAALREVKEETGLDVKIDDSKRYVFGYLIEELSIDKTVVLFLAQVEDGVDMKKQDSEIAELRWVPFDEVEQTLNFDAWRQIWRTILADLQNA